ncbi:12801_t:CDS:2, partial [Ambispora gerdemannii]
FGGMICHEQQLVGEYAQTLESDKNFKLFQSFEENISNTIDKNQKEKGVIHYQLIEGGAKTKDFHNFLQDIKLPDNEKYYLLLDNATIHHAVGACKKLGLLPIKELLISKKIEPKYLVAYSPQLNPVELCFNIIKKVCRKKQAENIRRIKVSD